MKPDGVHCRNMLRAVVFVGAWAFHHARNHNFHSFHHQIYGALHIFQDTFLCCSLRKCTRVWDPLQDFAPESGSLHDRWGSTYHEMTRITSHSRTKSNDVPFWYAWVYSHRLAMVLRPWKEEHLPFFSSYSMGTPIYNSRVQFHITCSECMEEPAVLTGPLSPDPIISCYFESFLSPQTPNAVNCCWL